MEISKSPQSAQKVTFRNCFMFGSFQFVCGIFKNLRNMIHRLDVTKMKSDKKEKVADVFNIIYDDIKPIHRFGKLRNCKNMGKLSMKMIRRITRSKGG